MILVINLLTLKLKIKIGEIITIIKITNNYMRQLVSCYIISDLLCYNFYFLNLFEKFRTILFEIQIKNNNLFCM